ncbi:hypothetical protein D3C73_1194440 [compost metagenome]
MITQELLIDTIRRKPATENTQYGQSRTAIQTDHCRRIAIKIAPRGTQRARRALFAVYAIVRHTIPYVSEG